MNVILFYSITFSVSVYAVLLVMLFIVARKNSLLFWELDEIPVPLKLAEPTSGKFAY